MLAEYRSERDGEKPPSLNEILGGPEPVDIWADIETSMEQMRQDRIKATTRTIDAKERWNESQKDNPYAAPRHETFVRVPGKCVTADDAGHSLPGWGAKP
ncbi:MAG: hypothetical protein ACOH2M_01305 [Cypionkella sp.]